MENSSKYFCNKECSYYPCHNGLSDFNCLFCYCPLYSWEVCPGNHRFIEKNGRTIKVCTDCTFPHKPENYEVIMKLLKAGEKKDSSLPSKEVTSKCCEKCSDKIGDKGSDKISDKGILYGIGVGPGESELLTFKARSAILSSDVIICPAKDKESCKAYKIVEDVVPEIKNKELVFMPFPMIMEKEKLADFHLQVAKEIESYLSEGKTVSFLTIGDPCVYSTYDYIDEIAKNDGFDSEYISGITSFCAAAARLGMPLTLGDESLHIVPGNSDFESAFLTGGTIVFMKVGKKLGELKNKLIQKEKEDGLIVKAVSNCGLENEVIYNSATELDPDAGYLTVIICRCP